MLIPLRSGQKKRSGEKGEYSEADVSKKPRMVKGREHTDSADSTISMVVKHQLSGKQFAEMPGPASKLKWEDIVVGTGAVIEPGFKADISWTGKLGDGRMLVPPGIMASHCSNICF